METFNKTELKAARTILKELLQKDKFRCLEVHVATVTLKALNTLIIKGYETARLKLSSLTEDEQDVTRAIAFFYGYEEMHFDGDDYFSVVIDDFDFNSSAITKLLVELFKRELLERYEAPNESHAEPYFDNISCCDILSRRTKSKENCYKLAVKIVKEYLKEESTMERYTTTMAEVAQDTAQPAPSETTNEQLTAEIKVYLGQIGQGIIEVGKRLIIMKGRLQHGEWQNWLKDNFQLSYRTAAQFMQIAERFGNVQTSAHLKSSQMVELLALPEAETKQFIEEKAAAGTPVEDMTVKKLREEIQQWKARAEDADKKIAANKEELRETQANLQNAKNALNEVIEDRASIAKERDAAISAARDAEEKLQNQQPKVVIQAPDDYDATKQALKDEQARNQQLQQQLTERPVEVTVPADYHDNKKALADAQEELASNRKALSDAHEQISNMLLEKQTQDAERLSAEEYAVAAKDLDTISALLLDLVYKKTQILNKVIKDYRQNNPQRLEQIIELFENFVRDYKR